MKTVRPSRLYVVFEANVTLSYSGLGYRALVAGESGRLKKNCPPCRYCGRLRMTVRFFKGCVQMSKRELIDCICEINISAKPEFLASFSEEELNDYLEHLMELDLEELVVCG